MFVWYSGFYESLRCGVLKMTQLLNSLSRAINNLTAPSPVDLIELIEARRKLDERARNNDPEALAFLALLANTRLSTRDYHLSYEAKDFKEA